MALDSSVMPLNPLAATLLKRYEAWQSDIIPGSAKGVVTAGGTIWLKQRQEDHDELILLKGKH